MAISLINEFSYMIRIFNLEFLVLTKVYIRMPLSIQKALAMQHLIEY